MSAHSTPASHSMNFTKPDAALHAPAPQLPVKAVIFDMDGTIMDSTRIIITTMQELFEDKLGKTLPLDSLRRYVGPPLYASFADVLGEDDEARINELVDAYRAVYKDREVGIMPFDGTIELLEELKAAGIKTAIATSKLQSRAQALLEHRKLDGLFDVVCGAMGDDVASASKAGIVRRALEALCDNGTLASIDPDDPGNELSRVVMVGDRVYDMEGAAANHLPAVGANWAHLAKDGEFDYAWKIVERPDDMLPILEVAP